MFTSLKKWVKNEENTPKSALSHPPGMQTMRSDLQRKFAKGVQYNSEYSIVTRFHFFVNTFKSFRTLRNRLIFDDSLLCCVRLTYTI